MKLRKQLDQHKGKKVYGYLPKPIKATVNEIVAQLSAEPAIGQLYKEWNKINREKLSLYYENKDPTVPLVDNKDFRSIKNSIIKAVMEITVSPEPVLSTEEKEISSDDIDQIRSQFHEENTESEPPKTADTPAPVIHDEEPIPINIIVTAKEIIGTLARLIGDKCMAHRQNLEKQIDRRLQQEINEKKQAMGLKTEVTQKASYQTEETYEMSM